MKIPFRTLCSNIETLKERGLENKTGEISIAVLEQSIEALNVNPTFYATRYGILYNPLDDFKPVITGDGITAQRIKGQLVEDYYKQLDEARKIYNEILEKEGAKGTGEKGNGELEKLVLQKENRITEQSEIITELRKENEGLKVQAKGSDEKERLNQLEKMIQELTKVQSNRIEIKIGDGPTQVIEKVVHKEFKKIITLLSLGEHVYLYGPAGTGKSELAKQVAEAMGLKFYPVSTVTQEFKLTGYEDGNGKFHMTQLFHAVVNGGLFFMDEMDASPSEVMVAVNGLLANGYFDFPTGVEYAHENFRIISAGNTIGHGGNEIYTGRSPLDRSTLDRFKAVRIDYSPEIDRAVAQGDEELLEFTYALRSAVDKEGIVVLMSYRSISSVVKLKDLFPLNEVMDMSVTKGMAKDDINYLARNMDIKPTNKYFKAFKQAI